MSEVQEFVLSWMEALVSLLPVGYAFGAGMVSTVNPCGFAMLPAYLACYLGARDDGFSERYATFRAAKALMIALSASAGFIILFSVVGSVISAGGSFIVPAMPWIAVVVGVSLLVLGGMMLAGQSVYAGSMGRLASRISDDGSGSIWSFFLFGIAFGAASLSCTLPIFLAVVGSALTTGGFLSGLVQFVSFGLGMSLVLIVVTLGIALFKEGFIVGRLRRAVPYLQRVAAVLVLVAGAYIVYYWLFKAGLVNQLAAAFPCEPADGTTRVRRIA